MKRIVVGGIAGLLYPVVRAIAAWLGPRDRMPDYPRFDLGSRSPASHVVEALSLVCLIVFVSALPAFARARDDGRGSRPSFVLSVVAIAAWGAVKLAATGLDPYRELTVVAASALVLAIGVAAAARLAAGGHLLAGYAAFPVSLLLLLTGATSLFPLHVDDARPFGLGLIHQDPGAFNPGGLIDALAFGGFAVWVFGLGAAMISRSGAKG